MPRPRMTLIEFPADEPDRARRFWDGLLELELEQRQEGQGEGWQSRSGAVTVGVHERGRGPGDSYSLPYFAVESLDEAMTRVRELGGQVIHPGKRWAICKDSEGSPFGLSEERPAS